QLIYSPISDKWEFATQETNGGKAQWIRRDQSWICNVGDELATMPVPAKPENAKPLTYTIEQSSDREMNDTFDVAVMTATGIIAEDTFYSEDDAMEWLESNYPNAVEA